MNSSTDKPRAHENNEHGAHSKPNHSHHQVDPRRNHCDKNPNFFSTQFDKTQPQNSDSQLPPPQKKINSEGEHSQEDPALNSEKWVREKR